jgi:hypothetical protein
MAAYAIAKSQKEEARRVAFALVLSLPFVILWWACAHAEPMRLTPPSVESAVLTRNVPQEEEKTVTPAPAPVETQPVRPVIRQKQKYNVVVFGDSLGDGLWAGLYHVLQKDKRFNVIKKSRVATGFSRHDYYDWNKAAHEIAAETKIDIAVVVMGTNDRQPIVQDGQRHALFDSGWREIYRQRVDEFTATLKATGAPVYWMEIPVMRSPRFGGDMRKFNEIFEERAAANGVTFVKTDGLATGADGGYTAYGEDRFGRTRLLRAEDGIHFTMAGYELLGARIADVMRADIKNGAPVVATVEVPLPVDETVVLRDADANADAVVNADAVAVTESTKDKPEKTERYDLAERRPGRSDDWLWLGATN